MADHGAGHYGAETIAAQPQPQQAPPQEQSVQQSPVLVPPSAMQRLAMLIDTASECNLRELRFLGTLVNTRIVATLDKIQEDSKVANSAAMLRAHCANLPHIEALHTLAPFLPLVSYNSFEAGAFVRDMLLANTTWHAEPLHLPQGADPVAIQPVFCHKCHALFTTALYHPVFDKDTKLKFYHKLMELVFAPAHLDVTAHTPTHAEHAGRIQQQTQSQLAGDGEVGLGDSSPSSSALLRPYMVHISIQGIEGKAKSRYFVFKIQWSNGDTTVAKRTHNQLFEFQCSLLDAFPEASRKESRIIPKLPGKKLLHVSFRRRNADSLAQKRRDDIEAYAVELIQLPPGISRSDIVLSFFNSCPSCGAPASRCKVKCCRVGTEAAEPQPENDSDEQEDDEGEEEDEGVARQNKGQGHIVASARIVESKGDNVADEVDLVGATVAVVDAATNDDAAAAIEVREARHAETSQERTSDATAPKHSTDYDPVQVQRTQWYLNAHMPRTLPEPLVETQESKPTDKAGPASTAPDLRSSNHPSSPALARSPGFRPNAMFVPPSTPRMLPQQAPPHMLLQHPQQQQLYQQPYQQPAWLPLASQASQPPPQQQWPMGYDGVPYQPYSMPQTVHASMQQHLMYNPQGPVMPTRPTPFAHASPQMHNQPFYPQPYQPHPHPHQPHPQVHRRQMTGSPLLQRQVPPTGDGNTTPIMLRRAPPSLQSVHQRQIHPQQQQQVPQSKGERQDRGHHQPSQKSLARRSSTASLDAVSIQSAPSVPDIHKTAQSDARPAQSPGPLTKSISVSSLASVSSAQPSRPCYFCEQDDHTTLLCQKECTLKELLLVAEEVKLDVPDTIKAQGNVRRYLCQFLWLKARRLHKYLDKLSALSQPELATSSVEQLEAMGITQGASKKLIKAVESAMQDGDPVPWPPLNDGDSDGCDTQAHTMA
eukprot:m.192207 g.192207  ORF g.192207 m.192207 type:complete len:934 (-) comp14851_c1_seq5:3242-6043(-)